MERRSITNNFDIQSYCSASISDISQLVDAHPKTIMQTLMVVAGFIVASKINRTKQSKPKNRELYHNFLENLKGGENKNKRSKYEHLDTDWNSWID